MKSTITSVIAILFITLVAGCAAQNSIRPNNTDTDIIQFTGRMVKGMSSKLDKLVVPLSAKTSTTADYKTYTNDFFPVAGGAHGARASLSHYCFYIGGIFDRGACHTSNEKLLFYSKLKYIGTYGGHRQYNITVVKPVGGNNSQFMAFAQKLGYRTPAQRAAARAENQRRTDAMASRLIARLRAKEHQVKLDAERIRRSERGTKVCRRGTKYTYVGFINRVNEHHMQIALQSVHLTRAPNLQPGGFTPHTTWTTIKGWRVCGR